MGRMESIRIECIVSSGERGGFIYRGYFLFFVLDCVYGR